MIARLIRYEDDGERCFGVLLVGPLALHTIERPWKDNERFVSCIPDGSYILKPWKSPSKGKCLKIDGCEPERTHCLFHSANWVQQVQGCVAPGRIRTVLDDEPAVGQSRAAMASLLALVDTGIELRITTVEGI